MPTETILLALVIIQGLCLVAVTTALVWRSRRADDDTEALRQMGEMLQDGQTLQAVVAERMQGLGPMAHNVGTIRAGLAELQAYVRARQEIERQTYQAIHRLEAVIAGTHSKGAAGESLLDVIFSQLPASWQLRNHRIGNKVVEFGLLLPNGLVLPIDSKWPATPLLEQFVASDPNDVEGRARLKAQIEAVALERVREVCKYVDPNLTVGFGLAVVPDAVFDLCRGIQAEALASQVAVVSHSLFMPYLLLVFETTLRASQSVDLQRLAAYLRSSQQSVRALQDEVEGRLSRAMTMLGNSRDRLAGELSKVQVELSSLSHTAEQLDSDSPTE